MTDNGFVIRPMTRGDMEFAVEWAAREGWNPGLCDAECFYNTDPGGFLIGELKGEPVGCISAVSYGESFGFIGFYIMKAEVRGKWYGVEMGRTAMARLGDRNIGIDGVVKKIKNYEKFGFTLAHRNIRYKGEGGGPDLNGVVGLAAVPFGAVLSYDEGIFPALRAGFLKQWITQPACASLGFLEGGDLKGYGVIRPCREGFKIGPLFADSYDIAEKLFAGLTARAPAGTPVFLDVPAINPAAVGLAERRGMTPVFETGRMYSRQAPAVPMEKVFGITSFELG